MAVLFIGLVFGLLVVIGGTGVARHLDIDGPHVPSGTAVILAGFVVLAGNSSAAVGYAPAMALLVGGVLVVIGWVRPSRISLPDMWTGVSTRPRMAIFLMVVTLALVAPLLIFPVPLDTDAQGFGYLSLMIRDGGSITSLAPWHPEIAYLYTPGALLVFATLSAAFRSVSMSAVMMGASHVIVVLFVWLAYEFGYELGRSTDAVSSTHSRGLQDPPRRWAATMALSAALSVGLWAALLDSHYTAVLALFFALACLTHIFRYQRTQRPVDALVAALMLSGVIMTQPDMAGVLALGLGSFSLLVWVAADRISPKHWFVISIGVPAAAVVFALPWLVSIWPLIKTGIESPFRAILSEWRIVILYHGVIWPLLALIGAGVYLRYRQAWVMMMVGWLLLALEFSIVGFLPRTFPLLAETLQRFQFPFSIAWHAPIIPYMSLGAGALVWIADRVGGWPIIEKVALPAMVSMAVFSILTVVFANRIMTMTRSISGPYGAFASANDVKAMRWLHDHTPPDARILNYPGDYEHLRDWEGHWSPVLTERDSVYFRMQPFFLDALGHNNGLSQTYAEQQTLLAFWRDPADAENAALLHQAGIDYVLVPDVVGNPASLEDSWRWQPPAYLPGVLSMPEDAPYLRLLYRSGGAQVYQLQP